MNAKQQRAINAKNKRRYGRNLPLKVSDKELIRMVEKRGGEVKKVGTEAKSDKR